MLFVSASLFLKLLARRSFEPSTFERVGNLRLRQFEALECNARFVVAGVAPRRRFNHQQTCFGLSAPLAGFRLDSLEAFAVAPELPFQSPALRRLQLRRILHPAVNGNGFASGIPRRRVSP